MNIKIDFVFQFTALEQQVVEFQDLFNVSHLSMTCENDPLVDKHKKLQALVKLYQKELENRVTEANLLRSQKEELQNGDLKLFFLFFQFF